MRTLITGLPPGLQLYGLVLVDRRGSLSNRLVVALRSFLVCLGIGVLAANLVFVAILVFEVPMFATLLTGGAALGPSEEAVLWGASAVGFLVMLGIAVHACVRPQRALVDLALGTTIVPK